MLVVQPSNSVFIGLDTNGSTVVTSTGLAFRFIRIAIIVSSVDFDSVR